MMGNEQGGFGPSQDYLENPYASQPATDETEETEDKTAEAVIKRNLPEFEKFIGYSLSDEDKTDLANLITSTRINPESKIVFKNKDGQSFTVQFYPNREGGSFGLHSGSIRDAEWPDAPELELDDPEIFWTL